MDRRTFLKTLGISAGAACVGSAMAQTTATVTAKTARWNSHPMFSGKLLIAHRGASSYAPENTVAAYLLAIKQGANLVEQDLHITKDGHLICSHDGSLNATTDVIDVFPDRFQEIEVKGSKTKYWMISDFTLAEIKQLKTSIRKGMKNPPADVQPTEIPTWQEAIDAIRGKAGLCPETKSEAYYKKLGFDMEKLVSEVLKKNGLDKANADSSTPVLMQSFDKGSLARLKNYGIDLPMILLQSGRNKTPGIQIAEAARLGYAAMGPSKDTISAEYVKQCHEAGLRVITYTYSPEGTAAGFADCRAEMNNHLYTLNIDGLFTNNPDMFPKAAG